MSNKLFPEEITKAEIAAGFEKSLINDLHNNIVGNPIKIKAVVCHIGDSDRVIKIMNPIDGGVEYLHQRYGWYDCKEDDIKPVWISISDPAKVDPAVAVQNAIKFCGDKFTPKIIPEKAPFIK